MGGSTHSLIILSMNRSIILSCNFRRNHLKSLHFSPRCNLQGGPTSGRLRSCSHPLRVFLFFYYLFFDFSKIYTSRFFLQTWPPVASATGGKSIPSDEPVVGALYRCYRRFIRRNFCDLGSSLSKNHN